MTARPPVQRILTDSFRFRAAFTIGESPRMASVTVLLNRGLRSAVGTVERYAAAVPLQLPSPDPFPLALVHSFILSLEDFKHVAVSRTPSDSQ